jgi:hypothetical protein
MRTLDVLPLPETQMKATGNDFRDLAGEERKGGTIRFVGTISRDAMRPQQTRLMVHIGDTSGTEFRDGDTGIKEDPEQRLITG